MSRVHLCSFHDASGEAVVFGRKWRWDFSEHFGPLFVGPTGKELKNQNPPRMVWRAFEEWLQEYRIAKRLP